MLKHPHRGTFPFLHPPELPRTYFCLAQSRSILWLRRAASICPIISCAFPMKLWRFPISSFLLGISFSGHTGELFSKRSAFLRHSSAEPLASTGDREQSLTLGCDTETSTSYEFPIPGSVPGQVGRGLKHPGVVEGVPAHGGGWNGMNFKVPSILNHLGILRYLQSKTW